MNRRKLLAILGALGALLVLYFVQRELCIRAWLRYGFVARACPEGEVRQTAQVAAQGLRRGADGVIAVGALAHFTTGPADGDEVARFSRVEPELKLLSAEGVELALPRKSEWSSDGYLSSALFAVPALDDGDYKLVARAKTRLGISEVTLPIGFYAPAALHLITDRPLYQPGDTVRFRAVVLRARDLVPLDGRPGRWLVRSPSGEVLLEERAKAGAYGVVSGDFPLDGEAEIGQWTASFVSGDAQVERAFTVEPFVLPRFSVVASASEPFYLPNRSAKLSGQVSYASGAPVAGAAVELDYAFGAWPPPTDWLEGLLPRRLVADARGRFELVMPPVPGDVLGRVPVTISMAATDATGDRVTGQASALFSADAIAASASTELDGKLVGGFNNRVYLRATTAAGQILPKTSLLVKRAWDLADKGVAVETDEDGVAALQLDPGPAVHVLVPAPPVRRPPRGDPVVRESAYELIADGEPELAAQVALDGLEPGLDGCAIFADEGQTETIALRVGGDGRVTESAGTRTLAALCLRERLARGSFGRGADRLFTLGYRFGDAGHPQLRFELETTPGSSEALEPLLSERARAARACLSPKADGGPLPRSLSFALVAGSKLVRTGWFDDPRATAPIDAATARCVESKLSLSLAEPADVDLLGTVQLSVVAVGEDGAYAASPTTVLGYELAIEARAGDELIGTTRLVLGEGEIPPLRIRATPVLPKPGEKVVVELIRGPGFASELPEKLWLSSYERSIEGLVDREKRRVEFTLPADARGWYTLDWMGVRAVVFVRSEQDLSVALRPARERYAPGELAELSIETRAGGRGVAAAVGLFGVDESLSQLAPLPGPDDLASVRPKLETRAPAFGVLDAEALTLGRIRGTHASAAAVLAVGSIPSPPDLDLTVYAESAGSFDPIAPLTDHFYVALAELYAQVRIWAETAPSGELMRPPTLAGLWQRALDACEQRGQAVVDAYGRRLRLSWLPQDLLALTDPRAVVVEGTRLPEDVEDWARWVAKERP